ncbi:MAG TPA: choice-of-anchor D domain-containing protein [Bryobacteraceae bacterium]|nr:choice-of-anchor D domain-containing protein [Bryobacteraceae bacterium]
MDRTAGYTRFGAIYPFIRQWLEASAQAIAQVAPTSLDFGSQQTASVSSAQSVTLTNIGQGTLTISSISINGSNPTEFSQTNQCGTSLAPGAACSIGVLFQPSSSGPRSAVISIADNSPASPQLVSLSGTGSQTRPPPTVLNQVTSTINGIAMGVCTVPPAVSVFPTNATAVWFYFDIVGALDSDVYHIAYYRPDGTVYTIVDAQSKFSGYECFSYFLNIAGFPPAAAPGVWTIRTFLNNSATPLITRAFTLAPPSSGPTISSFSASPGTIAAGGSATLTWSVIGANSVSISPSIGSVPSTGSRTVNPGATTQYTITAVSSSGTTTATTTLVVTTSGPGVPTVNQHGVVTVAAAAEAASPLSLVSIYGQRFTNGVTQTWNGANLTPTLAGVSVSIDGRPAYPLYVSPTFMNVEVPDSTAFGLVNVTVSNASGTSSPVTVPMAPIAPEFKSWSPVYVESNRSGPNPSTSPSCPYLACPIAPVGLLPFSTPARPGETISLWGLGWGPSNPRIPSGTIGGTPFPLSNQVTIFVGGVQVVAPYGAYLQGVGLYQINIVVPNLPDGDYDVTGFVGGVKMLKTLKLPIKH